MKLKVEELDNQANFRHILTLSYSDLVPFILDMVKKKTLLTVIYWSLCILFLCIAAIIRIDISGYYNLQNIVTHSILGFLVFPLLSIPVHEFLHIIPYYLGGARNIRVGMDLKQYLFYVTAHRYVASPGLFRIVALTPFIAFSLALLLLIMTQPGLWKWSLSSFLFVHSSMCAGDFALLNFYFINRDKTLYTWDDADKGEAYFFEKIEKEL